MTQIKLRRDTVANFTSKNPVLGVGEPAYETDTKKLKIGDGTTAYTQLEYFSAGGGGSADIGAALPLKIVDGVISLEVDGQTIQIVDGKLHANLDELGSEVNTLAGDVAGVQADLANKQDKSTAVTTNTSQTISGIKTFRSTPVIASTALNINNAADVSIQKQGKIFIRKAQGGQLVLSASNASIYLRPKGDDVQDKHVEIKTDGTVNATKFIGVLQGNVTGNVSGSSGSCTGNSKTATKATQDGNGNNIVNTYATKTSLNTKADTSLSNLTDAGKQAIKTISLEELNNPYSLFDSKYSDYKLNNLSWLKSEGQWNAKSVYPTAYDKLLKVQNGTETVEGLSVKLSTETYTDYDFVLNITDETFRLPLLDGSENILSNERISYDLPTASGQTYTAQYNGSVQFNATTSAAGQYIRLYNQTSLQITEQRPSLPNVGSVSYVEVKKGDVFQITGDVISTVTALYLIKAKGNGSLYYYVGETVQNANLIDAGRIGEQLANKQDKLIRYPIEISDKSLMPSWYVVYSDGWCEQGGEYPSGSEQLVTVDLLKSFKDTGYSLITQISNNESIISTSPAQYRFTGGVLKSSANQFKMMRSDFARIWYACGYIK